MPADGSAGKCAKGWAGIFEQMGCQVFLYEDRIFIKAPKQLKAVRTVRTMPYPGFPTDAQAIVTAALAKAKGTSVVVENIFENRYRHVDGAALKLVGEIFVYHMPFNRALGLELERYEKAFAQLSFNNQPMMVGNWAQSILHGGVIASALDVAAGLVCVGSTLTRHDTINEEELRQRLSRMGTIDLRVDYLRPGRGERFTATSTLLRDKLRHSRF